MKSKKGNVSVPSLISKRSFRYSLASCSHRMLFCTFYRFYIYTGTLLYIVSCCMHSLCIKNLLFFINICRIFFLYSILFYNWIVGGDISSSKSSDRIRASGRCASWTSKYSMLDRRAAVTSGTSKNTWNPTEILASINTVQ